MSEATITALRPKRSAAKPAKNSELAITTVETETARLALAGETWKWRENSGRIGCTQ